MCAERTHTYAHSSVEYLLPNSTSSTVIVHMQQYKYSYITLLVKSQLISNGVVSLKQYSSFCIRVLWLETAWIKHELKSSNFTGTSYDKRKWSNYDYSLLFNENIWFCHTVLYLISSPICIRRHRIPLNWSFQFQPLPRTFIHTESSNGDSTSKIVSYSSHFG